MVRANKYIEGAARGEDTPVVGFYAGTLHRNLELEGQGWLIPGNRCITNAVRFGGTIGVAHFTLNKFYFEGQGSLGIGLYIYTPKSFYLRKNTGYLDGQFWLSIGLNF